ncbi:hypothetical protein K3163_05805 [Qipengyuania sp. 1NDW9]|uniref:Uncharacterized protein n=1 Tax=Qipengyuania xiapuensis TaxID=2867236 RepID=A0ABX8ZYE8_9SPHN|nr:hypothetical protein [Qipengyuania xiapuensis]MBX7492717.1 hypothetical protein [Qipengyuania xiapuensis]QZD93109.1 hypothetical protein K3162_03470 [Qipengyuania xiapuensis]
MSATFHLILSYLLKVGAVAMVFNEVRGLVLAAPVLYGMYTSGGTGMAIWLGICALGGIALSVIVPLFAYKKLDKFVKSKAPVEQSA